MPLPPLPRRSPRVPEPPDDEPKTNPGVRRARRGTRALIAAMGTLATAMGGYAAKRASDADEAGVERMVRVEQRLADHIDRENERHAETSVKLEQLDKGQRRTERSSTVIKAMIDLELDQHHVPRDRRPVEEGEEP
jgi:hypothetical protein